MGEVVFELPFRNCSQKSCGLTSVCSASWNSQECEPIFRKGEWIPTACNIPKKHSREDIIVAFFFFCSLYRSRAWGMGTESIDISIDTKTEWRWGSDAAYASNPSTWDTKAGRWRAWGQPELHCDFQTSLGSRVRLYIKSKAKHKRTVPELVSQWPWINVESVRKWSRYVKDWGGWRVVG